LTVYRNGDLEEEVVKPGVRRKVVVGEKMMLVFYRADPGNGVSEHTHPHEQMGYILDGEGEFKIGDKKFILKTGDTFHVPPNVPHSGLAIGKKPLIEIDFFHPIREDLLKKSSGQKSTRSKR